MSLFEFPPDEDVQSGRQRCILTHPATRRVEETAVRVRHTKVLPLPHFIANAHPHHLPVGFLVQAVEHATAAQDPVDDLRWARNAAHDEALS